MKICFVGDGTSVHTRRWSGWLKQHGHTTQMISLTPRANHREYSEVIEVIPKRGVLGYSRTIFPIRKAVKKLNPDVVHGHSLTEGGFYASWSGHKVVVNTAWGSDIFVDARVFLKRQCIKYAIKHSEIILGECDHIMNEVKKLVPKADVRKVIFGIDTELFKPQPVKHDKFTLLSVRATGGVYSPMSIVQAFERAELDAILMMQEPMADGFHVREYVQSRPELEKKIVWYSRRVYSEMPKLYNSADVGISIPSSDSTSQAMMECMACGLPVLASDIPVNREWIEHHVNGYLSNSVSSLRDQMKMLARVHEGDGFKHISERAREKIMRNASFDIEMLKAERIYKEVLVSK